MRDQPTRSRGHALLGCILASVMAVALSCNSIDVVRLQPDMIEVPDGMEPVAGIQATCVGFYLFTLGLPDADLEKAVNELLMTEARKLGAERVMNLRFEATPEGGIWWLTKLLGFRSAKAWGVAIKREPGGDGKDEAAPPPPLMLPSLDPNGSASKQGPKPSPGEKQKKPAPSSQPAL